MKKYYPRLIDKVLENELSAFGAVLITGPKWCGKTTTAKRIANSFINFQDQDKRSEYIKIADIQPSALLVGEKPRLIDEWQTIPKIWDSVRQDIDEQGVEGLYILTGSNTVDKTKILHSGVGRISRLQMRTMSLYESTHSNGDISLRDIFNNEIRIEGNKTDLSINDISELIVRGGWPQTIDKSIDIAMRQNRSYIDLIASEEIKSVDGKERDKTKVLELMKSLARNTATSAADTTILEDIKSNITSMHINTVNEYLKDLRELYVIEDLPAWTPKIRSKTAVRTKYVRHFSDPALAAALLNAGPNDLINDINTFGFLFESLVIRDLRIYAQRINGEVYHYRDSSNLEVDAIIHLSDGRWGAAEIKLGAGQIDEAAINLQKLKNKVDLKKKPSFLMVITGTEYAYKREDDVYVIPIGVLRD